MAGAQKDGILTIVKLGRRELRVIRVATTAYSVREMGEKVRGTAWKLQLKDDGASSCSIARVQAGRWQADSG
jgi:hypothetical protein